MSFRKVFSLSASLMLQTILLSFVISSICLLLNLPVSKYSLLLGMLSAILICKVLIEGSNWNSIFFSTAGVAFISTIIIFISCFLYDYSWDGNWYHSHMIWELSHGWNPLYGGLIPDGEQFDDVLWANYYQKGYELLCSNIVCITDNINSGKSVNIMLPLLSFYFVYECLDIIKSSSFINIIISLVISFNPIVINQMLVHYCDWIGYTCIILIASNSYLWYKNDRKIYFINALLSLSFVTTVKYNITFYSSIIILVLFLLFIPRLFRKWQYLVSGVLVAFFSLLFFGGASIINNTIKKGLPLYPLYGGESIDIMTINTPSIYLNKSRFYQVNHSILSNPNTEKGMSLISPFEIDSNSLKSSSSYHTRIGGGGEFFFEATLLLIVLFIFSIYKQGHVELVHYKLMTSIIVCYALLYVLPSGWWARYNAYIYVIPSLLILYLYISGVLSMKMVSIPAVLLIFNLCISVAGVAYRSVSYKAVVNYIIKEKLSSSKVQEINTNNYCFVHMLCNNGAEVKFSNRNCCKWKLTISPYVYIMEPIYISKKVDHDGKFDDEPF